jgi:phosphate transport system substrate-binding protein
MSWRSLFKSSCYITNFMLIISSITACNGGQELKSQVSIDGAAVGFPISLAVAEEYGKVKPQAQVSVASSGTGGGISKFCNGDIDIVGASRTIRDEEIKKCSSKKIEFVELP